MKFVYEYRTSDNVLHSGEISASDREAAFSALRGKGIKPSKVMEAPGLANKVLGRGKRWLVIGILTGAVAVLVLALHRSQQEIAAVRDEVTAAVIADPYCDNGLARPIDRRQIWGDEAVIAQAAAQNWKVIFQDPADRLLALFAQPGFQLSVFPRVPATIREDLLKALDNPMSISANDLDEYKQMKCIVAGMKDEFRRYLKAGGNVDGYLRRLALRQKEEAEFVEKARKDLDQRVEKGEDAFAAWQEINKMLRDQGLKSIPLPANLGR